VRVLVVEDSVKMAGLLRRGLTEEGYAVDVAASGLEGAWMATEFSYDVLIFDVMLPDIDGFETLRRVREAGTSTPVLMLTARDAVEDRILGLDTGADDYLTKPFAFPELLARVRALARRGPAERAPVLVVDDLRLDSASHRVTRGEIAIDLTPKEFALLECFMRAPGEALSRTRILEGVWDFAFDGDSNVVDVYLRYLREKIDRSFVRSSNETVCGVGSRIRTNWRDR